MVHMITTCIRLVRLSLRVLISAHEALGRVERSHREPPDERTTPARDVRRTRHGGSPCRLRRRRRSNDAAPAIGLTERIRRHIRADDRNDLDHRADDGRASGDSKRRFSGIDAPVAAVE